MFNTHQNNRVRLNRTEFRDKVLGCWTGKNIGGTLGAPFEGNREMNQTAFYVQDLKGDPVPNDDLDLQLVWLSAVERFGAYNVNERVLGEFWLDRITAPWNEYGVCLSNLRNGLTPPLSGSCNNERWKVSNGAWIRSEIWACLFPGSPDEAAVAAYHDACCDHSGDGIYAEVFTAALESAAFTVKDLSELVSIALARIPRESRVARAVKRACECYEKHVSFADAREQIVRETADLGFFQAAGNLGFLMLGLLYGEGDFSRTVTLAVNCGDDTDCTGGTAGSIMGILLGRSGIPEKWTAPIGEAIRTCTLNTYCGNNIPADLNDLTDRVIRQAEIAAFQNSHIPQFTDEATFVPENYAAGGKDSAEHLVPRIWQRDPYEFNWDLPYGLFRCVYENGPYFKPGEAKKLRLLFFSSIADALVLSIRLNLPPGWKALPAPECVLEAHSSCMPAEITLIPAETEEKFLFLPVTIKPAGRLTEHSFRLPLQNGGPDMLAPNGNACVSDWELFDRKARIHFR